MQTAALFVTTCILSVRYWPALAVQFRRPGFGHWSAWAGVAMLAPLLAANFYYHGLMRHLGGVEGLKVEELGQQLGQGFLIFMFCVAPAVIEEIGFRGLLQHWLHIAVRPATAIMLASALFTVMHFTIISAPYIFAVGMLLGWTRWKSGSLYPSMLIHFLHNFVVVVYFSGWW